MSRSHPHALHGLYAITDASLCPPTDFARKLAEALAGGARLIQYRDKSDDHELRRAQAEELVRQCRAADALSIINDDVELALATGADGVHLGRDDGDLAAARAQLGAGAVIGLSCYNEFERAERAAAAGADYLAFGRFFPSGTKPLAAQAEPDLLRRAQTELAPPLVAIGGITPENGGRLIEAGAHMLAVVQGVFGQPDVSAACRRFASLFPNQEPDQ